tara:strand:- start:361 stop:576 length:216 start_codon:yes stop_codon:yes gene_type:complete
MCSFFSELERDFVVINGTIIIIIGNPIEIIKKSKIGKYWIRASFMFLCRTIYFPLFALKFTALTPYYKSEM